MSDERTLRNLDSAISRVIGMGLLFFAGWDAHVYLYPNWNYTFALVPIAFYVLAGAYLILRR